MAATRQDMTQGAGDVGSLSMTGIAVVHAGLGDRTSSLRAGLPKSDATIDIPLSGIFNIDVVTPLVLVTSCLGPA
jgi:hypothetical protein